MALVIELVDAPALYKAVESTFIGSFMDIQPTGGAAQISLGLLKGVLAFGLVGNLLGQEIGNDLSPGEFFLDGPARAMLLRVLFLQQHLWTLLGQLVCYGVCCQGLMRPFSTGTALISTSMRLPSVIWCLPWLSTLVHQLLFVLLHPMGMGAFWCK